MSRKAIMRQQVERRLHALQAEWASGQHMLAELEAQQTNLRNTLLRISGAMQVLEELLAQAPEEVQSSGELHRCWSIVPGRTDGLMTSCGPVARSSRSDRVTGLIRRHYMPVGGYVNWVTRGPAFLHSKPGPKPYGPVMLSKALPNKAAEAALSIPTSRLCLQALVMSVSHHNPALTLTSRTAS